MVIKFSYICYKSTPGLPSGHLPETEDIGPLPLLSLQHLSVLSPLSSEEGSPGRDKPSFLLRTHIPHPDFLSESLMMSLEIVANSYPMTTGD